jgi:hypothetical protein
MAIVRVHIGHLSDVPNFEASVIRHRVELIVLSIKLDGSYGVSVANESLYLFLVVNVPNSDDPIFSTTN